METVGLLNRLLDVIEYDIAPLTRREVARGNKIFGAAILLKSDLSLVIAETNNEVENPLWHGEMHAIKRLYERDRATLPNPRDCLFLARTGFAPSQAKLATHARDRDAGFTLPDQYERRSVTRPWCHPLH